MKKLAIERKQGIAPAEFAREHLQGLGKPVVITDAMESWPALSKWTFDFFKAAYGSDYGTAPFGLNSEVAKLTKISAYIDYLDRTSDELPGFLVNNRDGKPMRVAPRAPTSPPYLLGWQAFKNHPELREDVKPAPYFIADWVTSLDPRLRDLFEWVSGREYWSVYIGPEGALSPLHRDFWHTHACLAQIRGKKSAILFSPEDTPFLYDGDVDPENPDLERFSLFSQATAYECIIEPGDILFIPPAWWHCVRGLEKSITVSHNFFNDTNVNEHLAGLIRNIPTLVEGLERFPEWRDELAVKWRSKGFEDPMA